ECPRNWSHCQCGGSPVSLSRASIPSIAETIRSYQIKGASDAPAVAIPKYLQDVSDFFDTEKAGILPEQGGFEHAIDTIDSPPYGPLYNLSELQLAALREYLSDALRKRWIRPSVSPAGAPILFVPKKDGGLRLCVDYRGL